MNAPTTRHRLEYLGYRIVSRGARILRERAALALGSLLGQLAGGVFRVRRGDVDANLARAFPHRSPEWRRGVAMGCYRHVAREAIMMLRMAGMEVEDLRARISWSGMEHLEAARDGGRGAILVSGHLGNWEISGAALASLGLPIDAVAQVQHNPLFNEALAATRGRLGMRVIDRGDAVRQGLRSLRNGRMLGLVADQNVRSGGVFVDFFGIPASTARGPGLLAARTGSPVLTVMALRKPGSPSHYHIDIQRVELPELSDPDEQALRVMEAFTGILERYIERAPEQYFWFHRRWKTRPDDEAPGDPPRNRPPHGNV